MFQKKLNLTPLGPELPKIQVCVATQEINSPPVNVPLPPWVTWGCLYGGAGSALPRVFRLFASPNPQRGTKVLSESVPRDFRC